MFPGTRCSKNATTMFVINPDKNCGIKYSVVYNYQLKNLRVFVRRCTVIGLAPYIC